MARIRQPYGPAKIDWSNPLARDLSFAFDGNTLLNAASGRLLTPVNGVSKVATSSGLRANFVRASQQYINCGSGNDVDLAGANITIAAQYSLASIESGNISRNLVARDDETNGRSYTFDVMKHSTLSLAGVRFYTQGGGSENVNMISEGRDTAVGDNRFAVARWNPSANESAIWIDGSLAKTTTASSTIPASTDVLCIGSRTYSGFEDYFDGTIGFVGIWKRPLSDNEIRELSRNPWQLFTPQRRLWIQLGTATTGDTSLAIPDSTLVHTLDNVVLTGVGSDTNLVTQDSAQAHTLDATVLTTASNLTVAEISQAHTTENLTLDASLSTNLVIQEASQAQVLDAVTLVAQSTIVIQDSTQDSSSDNTILTSAHSLIVADTAQTHLLDVVTLDTGLILTVNDSLQSHQLDSLTLLAASTLAVQDGTQTQLTDSIDLSTLTALAINDTSQAMSSEEPAVYVPGTGTGASPEEIAIAVVAALMNEVIPVNVKQINDTTVAGTGTDPDPWR